MAKVAKNCQKPRNRKSEKTETTTNAGKTEKLTKPKKSGKTEKSTKNRKIAK